MKKGTIDKYGKLIKPLAKAAVNIPTLGFGGAIMEILDIPHEEIRRKNINDFIKQINRKISELNLKISETEFKKRMKSPEFFQIFVRMYNKVQIEKRKQIRKAYSNLLVQLLKNDPKINFNQNLFYLEILESLNEDHIKILSFFYKGGDIKDRFSLELLYKKLGCYELRKPLKGESIPLFSKNGKAEFLNHLKASYFKGLISDLNSKQLINKLQTIESIPEYKDERDKEVTSVESEIKEEYQGTELGRNFYKSI